MNEFTCVVCGKKFKSIKKERLACSRGCSNKSRKWANRQKPILKFKPEVDPYFRHSRLKDNFLFNAF